ncbi:thiopeptide-type bacteriocin biosynthesis protein [Streptomyces fenghuangensis]
MSPDRLIQTEPSPTTRAVLAVLAGLPVPEAARRFGMEPTDLADAVAVFQQAGHEALARHSANAEWRQVILHFGDWATSEHIFAAYVLPLLRGAEDDGTIDGWWYTRKHPCWRLRLHVRPGAEVKADLGKGLDRLVADGHLHRWWPGIYEPETAAFGGPAGMAAAHALFVADSHEAVHLGSRDDIPLGRRELSVMLCTAMMRAAGLEWYEQGDVWHRVITDEHRSSIGEIPQEQLGARTREIRALLLADCDTLQLPGGPLESTTEWIAAFRRTGHALAEAAHLGTLDRGLRRVLSLHVIFHWNRLGLSMRTQSALAWAARAAILGSK